MRFSVGVGLAVIPAVWNAGRDMVTLERRCDWCNRRGCCEPLHLQRGGR